MVSLATFQIEGGCVNIKKTNVTEPSFAFGITRAINSRKNIQVLTGGVQGLFPSVTGKGYVTLEQSLVELMQGEYIVLALDLLGLSLYNPSDVQEIAALLPAPVSRQGGSVRDQLVNALEKPKSAVEVLVERLAQAMYMPLASMALLREICLASHRSAKARPICVVVRHAASLFPERELGMLDQQDRQRLVYVLNWLNEDWFTKGRNLFLMVENSCAEINQRVVRLPGCEHLQIPLPNRAERLRFVTESNKSVADLLNMSVSDFVDSTAGLPLAHLEDLLEVAQANQTKVTKKDVVGAINQALQIMMGNIVTFKTFNHTLNDVIGYDKVKTILTEALQDCDDPQTAVPGFLISGANGVGKTWIIEALANESGWVVIELSGLRDEAFGGTEKFFEQFKLVVETFGRIMVEVDEAHTAFGSVHSSQTHEVERRLGANVIKMMGNPVNYGKILWVLMTSRPDELDPDVKSRLSSVQVPIFDLEGDERVLYIKTLFDRKGVVLDEQQLVEVVEATKTYCNRDLGFLPKVFLARRKRKPELTVPEFLKTWSAGSSILGQRRFQELLAHQHCTFPELIPARLAQVDPEKRDLAVETFKLGL